MGSSIGFEKAGKGARGSNRSTAPLEAPPEIDNKPFRLGEIIAGKYRIEREIGRGKMGVVVAARHLDLDEVVALKFIRPETQTLPGVVGRFAREAKASVRIKSDHVVKVLDVAMVPGRGPCIVMEYLEGETLADLLIRTGPLPIRRAAEYVMQICEALTAAHVEGITHRDIKPENLFITRRGDLDFVKVLDFGISKAALTGSMFGGDMSLVETSCLMGTPLYMSPEQIRATGEVDHRTDIWSLGAVLHELLTGGPPFSATSLTQLCAQVLENEPISLGERCAVAPPDLQAIIARCLEKNLAKRYQNVAEIAIDLVPFAPSRCRPYAQRCASILRAAGIELGLRLSDSSIPIPSLKAVAVSVPKVRVPSEHARSRAGASRPTRPAKGRASAPGPSFAWRRRRRIAPIVVGAAAVLGALLLRPRSSAPRVAPLAAQPEPLTAAPARTSDAPPTRPAAVTLAVPASQTFSTVLIESEPPGALVDIAGHALGKTPLRTLAAAGPMSLRLAKPGYATENVTLLIDPASDGFEPVRERVVLHRSSRTSARPGLLAPPTDDPSRAQLE